MKKLEKSDLQSRLQENMTANYCPKCDYNMCQCDNIAAEAKESQERALKRDCEALGGPFAVRCFTISAYHNHKAVADCSEYPAKGLYIYGPTGCGKTHLATALVRQQKGASVIKPMSVLRKMRSFENSNDEDSYIKALSVGPLVIDDLGVEKLTEFAITTLYEIFDRRWLSDSGGLIVTSNLGLTALAAKIGDDRITSRIAGMCKTVKIDGTDGRLNQKGGGK
jgi:DNA replication protein DnaC